MRVEILCEDRSSVPVLQVLLKDLLDEKKLSDKFELFIHPHRGLGYLPQDLWSKPAPNRTGLYDLLPAKLRAYERLAAKSPFLIVVVHDSDENDPDDIYQQLEFLFRKFSPTHYFVIGISVEELESWLLGDFHAISQAYPRADRKLWEEYKQDSVCGTWEKMACIIEGKRKGQELIRIGYPAVGLHKSQWAERISPYLKAERNASPSLHTFLQRFERGLEIMGDKVD